MKRYLTPADLAELIDVSTGTLARFRTTGEGPDFTKIGRSVLYSDEAVDIWLARNTFSSTSQYGP